MTTKMKAARESLPESKRPIFDALVADYQESAQFRSGWKFVAPLVIADLVAKGWAKQEAPE